MNEPIIIHIPGVDEWPITQLRYACKKNKVKGYTKMSREELIQAVKRIIANFKDGDKDGVHRESHQ